MSASYYIGIDGGGTKTDFVLVDSLGNVIKRIKTVGSNPSNCGIKNSCKILRQGIDELLKIQPSVRCISAGLAGYTSGKNSERFDEFFNSTYPGIETIAGSDIENVFGCRPGFDNCIAVICGTGLAVFAKVNNVKYPICGYGYLFEEKGSGYDIGRDAIRYCLQKDDGIKPACELTSAVEERICGSVHDKLDTFYMNGKDYIASFAKTVFSACRMGDKVAENILLDNFDAVNNAVVFAKKQFHCGNKVIVTGGVINEGRGVIKTIFAPALDIDYLTMSPVYGACANAVLWCEEKLSPQFEENFLKSVNA